MDFKSMFSDQPTVDISVVKIKGKKVTKSILNQMETASSYLPNSAWFDDAKIIGYVSSTDQFPWMIVEKDGRLFKSDLHLLLKIIDSRTVKDAFNFIDVDFSDDIDMDASFTLLPTDALHKFHKLQDEARLHLSILKSHQIYI